MPVRLQFGPLLDVIKQFTVENDMHSSIFVGDRLLAIRQADDTKPPGGKLHATPPKEALLIRTAMDQCLCHGVDDALGHRPLSYQIYDTCNATHIVSSIVFGLVAKPGVCQNFSPFDRGLAAEERTDAQGRIDSS
jgi:hypothetical protein